MLKKKIMKFKIALIFTYLQIALGIQQRVHVTAEPHLIGDIVTLYFPRIASAA